MSTRFVLRSGATVAAASLALLAAGPAFAAEPVAQASSTALTLTVAGTGSSTGHYGVTNDGTKQTAEGTNRPALGLLGNQKLISAGTLAQDATTSVTRGKGSSAACSGLAGEGATLVAVGDGTCLTPADAVALNVANLDLSHLTIANSALNDALRNGGLDPALLDGAVQQLTGPVGAALQQVVGALGSPGVYVDLGAVQGYCQASTTSATGGANLADAGAFIDAPAPIGRVDLLDLPVNPAPNTHVVSNLDALTSKITDALSANLATSLGGALGPLATVVDQAAVINTLIDQISTQLAPLEQNLLDITLNEQETAPGAIHVTALRLEVLPAAAEFIDADLLDVAIGEVTCGPNGRAIAPPNPQPTTIADPGSPAVPTAVEAGMATLDEDGQSPLVALALGGLALAAGVAGVTGYRRSLR